MKQKWEKVLESFRTKKKEASEKVAKSKLSAWIKKQVCYRWILSKKTIIVPLIAILALFSYAFLIRNELKVGENQGNIKLVASKSKDSLSKGYKENIRTNLTVNGTPLNTEKIIRQEWGQYGAGIPIPIYIADAETAENQTLEIQYDEPIKNLSFEYSAYDVGGYLQIYLDDVLYTQINTYNDSLVYKSITFNFDQHYAITKSNLIWWGQLLLYLILIFVFIKKNKSNGGDKTKSSFVRNFFLAIVLFGLALGSLQLAFQYGETKDFYFFNSHLTPLTVSSLLVCLLILSSLVKEVSPELKQVRLGLVGQGTYLFINGLAPFVSLYLIETAYSIYSVEHLSSSDYQANILILSIIWICLALLTTSIRAASILLVAGGMIVGIVTKILLIARNMPLLSYHFLQVRDGLSVAGDTDFYFTSNVFTLIFISWCFLIVLFFLPKFDQLFDFSFLAKRMTILKKYDEKFTAFQRRLIQKASLIGLGIISVLFLARPTIYAVANSVDLSLYFWTMQSTYYDHGLPVALTRYHLASQITEPEGYSNTLVEDILSDYPRIETTSNKQPNIILIQNESLTDYSALTNLEFSSDPLEFIHSLEKNTIKGTLDVSVFAGSTANTEYEVLTSNSMAILPPNSFPFQQLISSPKNSIVNNLNNQGYSSYAFHPYGKDNYRRSQVFGYLGFDLSYFENSDPSFKDLVDDPERIRGYISDHALYEGSKKLIEDSDDPIFNFIVTMQGHGGYNKTEEDFPRTISVTNAEDNAAVTDFLSSIDASDKAFEALTNSLSSSDEPTVVVMYGDHQPILADSYFKPYLDSSDPSARFQTPFIIWANFDLPSVDETTISPNYLVPYLYQVLSQTEHALPISSYYQFLSKVQAEIPVMTTWGYYDSNYTYSESAPTSELYKQYQYVEYNNVIDKKSIEMTDYYQ